jgi:hypothetical protein
VAGVDGLLYTVGFFLLSFSFSFLSSLVENQLQHGEKKICAFFFFFPFM